MKKGLAIAFGSLLALVLLYRLVIADTLFLIPRDPSKVSEVLSWDISSLLQLGLSIWLLRYGTRRPN